MDWQEIPYVLPLLTAAVVSAALVLFIWQRRPLGARAAAALLSAAERESLLAAEHEQRLLAETLTEVTLALTAHTDFETILGEILYQALRLVPYKAANISLLEGDTLRAVRWQGYDVYGGEGFVAGLRQPLDTFAADAEAVRSGRPVVVSDAHRDPRWVVCEETAWIRSDLIIPIRLHDRVLGVLRLDSDAPGDFSSADGERLLPLANAAAIALENARLLGDIRRRAAHQAALSAIVAAASKAADLPALLETALQHALQALGLTMGATWVPGRHTACQPPEIGAIACDMADLIGADIPHTIAVSDWRVAGDDTLPAPVRRMIAESCIRASLTVPILGDGRRIGGLSLADSEPRAWSSDEVALIEAVGRELGGAAERLRLFTVTREHAELMDRLVPLSEALNRPRTQSEVLEAIGQGAMALSGADRVAIYDMDRSDTVVCHWQQGLSPAYLEQVAAHVHELPGGRVLEQTEPVLIPHVPSLPADSLLRRLAEAEGYQALGVWPLVYRGRTGAAVACYCDAPHLWSHAEEEMMEAFARQAAIALENARLFERTLHRQEELAALYQTSLEIAGASLGQDSVQPLLERIVARATGLLAADGGGLYLVSPDEQSATCVVSFQTRADYTGVTLPRGEGAAGHVLATGEPLIIDDYRVWSGQATVFAAGQPFRGVISVPLKWGDRVTGILHVLDYSGARHFGQDDLQALQMFAHHAATAIEYSRRLAAERRWSVGLETLHQVALDVSAHLEPATVLQVIVQRAAELLGARGGGVYLYDPDDRELELVVSYNLGRDYSGIRLRLGEGLAGQAVQERRPTKVDNYSTWPGRSEQFEDAPFTAALAIPLQVGERILGALNITDMTAGRVFEEDDVRLAMLFAAQAAAALENARLYAAEQTRRRDLDALYALSRELAATDDIASIATSVAQHGVETVNVTFCRVLTLEDDGSFFCRAAHPLRTLGVDLGVGRPEPELTWPYYRDVLSRRAPRVLVHDAPWFSTVERRLLFMDAAQSICLAPVRVGDKAIGVLILGEARNPTREPFDEEKLRLTAAIADQGASALHRACLYEDLEEAYVQTALALANAMDARDAYTADHSQRLADWAIAIARELRCTGEEVETLRWATLLHDIGKIGIPDQILLKPGPLDDDERMTIELHPEIGERIVAPVRKLAHVGPIIRAHQEHWDGSGYPDGLRGEGIPLLARILSVVDAYGAMTDNRIYRAALTHEQAAGELRSCAGTQFDPQIVEVFLGMLGIAEEAQ